MKSATCYISFAVLLTCQTPYCHAQEFHNLDFLQKCDSTKTGLCHWELSWGGAGSVASEVIDNRTSLFIQGKSESSVGFVEQIAPISDANNSKIITISASIKSDSIEGKGAGLNIGLYDRDGKLIANRDMGGFYSLDWIRGSTLLKECSISIVCPQATEKVRIGMILYGKGKVWYTNMKVKIDRIGDRKPSKLAMEYLSAVCDIIQQNSLIRDSLNILELKKTALRIAGSAAKYSDCYLAVTYLLESLRPFGDHHSFFMTAKEVQNWKTNGSQVSKIQFPEKKVIDGCGYILVPAFHSGNPSQMIAFADSIQAHIKELNNSGITGWIIDLRKNTGGNMAPMVAGLGPLFSTERLGALVDMNGGENAWHYQNGRYYWDDDSGWSVTSPVQLDIMLPIAVLVGNQTGSSGEAVAISFIGNDKTKLFGTTTWGLTTGNGSFDLLDGSQVFLASTYMSDRNHRHYESGVIPDVIVNEGVNGDDVLEIAIGWVNTK